MHRLQELASRVGGRVIGDPDLEIEGLRPFDQAGSGDLTLAVRRKLLHKLSATRAAAVIVDREIETQGKSLLLVENPRAAFARIMQVFYSRRLEPEGHSPRASVGRDCLIGDEVTIGPFSVLEDGVRVGPRTTIHPGVFVGRKSVIGADCVLYPNVVLYPDSRLGKGVIIHGGTVIGADGFGYAYDGQRHLKIPQIGWVEIEDEAEIGANSCVDRGTFGPTVIGKGVKLDNHVHIGHNCRIGEHTVIVGQVGLSGSVEVGKNCTLAGHSGVVDHVRIGDNVTVLMKSAVSKDVPSNAIVSGQPAGDHRRQMKIQALLQRLPEMYEAYRRLKKQNDFRESSEGST